MKSKFLIIAFAISMTSCVIMLPSPGPQGPPPSKGKDYKPYKSLGIPPGHLPPPGSCRIWYPGKPPGHQPPPGNCAELLRQVPLGAWIIYRPSGKSKEIKVDKYHEQKRGFLVAEEFYLMD